MVKELIDAAVDDREEAFILRVEDENFTDWQRGQIYSQCIGSASSPLEKISTKVLKRIKYEFSKLGVESAYEKFMFNPKRKYEIWVEYSSEGTVWGISPVTA